MFGVRSRAAGHLPHKLADAILSDCSSQEEDQGSHNLAGVLCLLLSELLAEVPSTAYSCALAAPLCGLLSGMAVTAGSWCGPPLLADAAAGGCCFSCCVSEQVLRDQGQRRDALRHGHEAKVNPNLKERHGALAVAGSAAIGKHLTDLPAHGIMLARLC